MSPDPRQAIIKSNAVLKSVVPFGTKFSEIWIQIIRYSFKKIYSKMAFIKWLSFCLGLKVSPHSLTKSCLWRYYCLVCPLEGSNLTSHYLKIQWWSSSLTHIHVSWYHTACLTFYIFLFKVTISILTDTWRNNNVVITSKRRRFGVIMTLLFRRVSARIQLII